MGYKSKEPGRSIQYMSLNRNSERKAELAKMDMDAEVGG